MFELLTVAVVIWLLVKAAGFAFMLTWGVAKIVATILIGVALPVLIVCLVSSAISCCFFQTAVYWISSRQKPILLTKWNKRLV